MKRFGFFLVAMMLNLIFFAGNSVYAKRFKIVQTKKTYDREVLFTFLDRPGMQDDKKWVEFFLTISEDKLEKVARANEKLPEIEEVIIFVDSETGDFRTNVSSQDGKMSMIFTESTKMMCSIDWGAMTYFCMSMVKMKNMQKDAQKMMSQMPDIEKMLQNIPAAQREQAMKALKDAQKNGMPQMSGAPSASTGIEITKTGKTRRVDGDVQQQVKFTKGSENGVAWISRKYPELTQVAQKISENMKENFGPMAEDDIRSQFKDGFPIELRTFEQNMMRGQASLEIEKVTKIERGFSGNPFEFDKSRLKEQSPMGMPKM